MARLATCLTFKDSAEEAIRFYVSLFPNSRVTSLARWGPGAPLPEGRVMHATFELDGVEFRAMDGGDGFGFAPGHSMFAACDTQAEVDRVWAALGEGGSPVRCGWITDRFGVSWQVVPKRFMEMMTTGDDAARDRALAAMMPMVKLDLDTLERAYAGR